MIRTTVIDLNPVEVKYYPLMIILDNVLEVVMPYLQKYVFKNETKDINVKAFNMIPQKNGSKT